MELQEIANRLPRQQVDVLIADGIKTLRPSQEKAIAAGLLEQKNLLICTPTASGKTLIAEMAALSAIHSRQSKAIYIVPLVALASEKFQEFKRRYGSFCSIALAVGDPDHVESGLSEADLIVCTSEKLDSLLRHHAPWISRVDVVVVDEIHLLNDPSRGPTLEILLTLLRLVRPHLQIIGLSATIGNPDELAAWLGATLVLDTWRPVKLLHGVFADGKVSFEKQQG